MDLTTTGSRTRLTVENVSDLMFISIDGAPVENVLQSKTICKGLATRPWIGGLSSPRGKERKETDEEKN